MGERLLFLVNEPFEGYQVGYRAALDDLVNDRTLECCRILSFIPEEQRLGSWNAVLDEVLEIAKKLRPTAILIAHSRHRPFHDGYLDRLRSSSDPAPILAYDERDVFGYVRKPLPRATLHLASRCDVVFLVARGKFAERFRRAGCGNLVYLPHAADTRRFGTPWTPTRDRDFDVVMIANLYRSRCPWRSIPGTRARFQLGRALYRRFGRRFRVYGAGWDDEPYAAEPIPFGQQEQALRQAWLSIGQEHFPELEGYFSDRLPVALLSGVGYVTNRIRGMETVLRHGEHVLYFDSPAHAVEVIARALDAGSSELIALGARGNAIARSEMTEEVRMRRLMSAIAAVRTLSGAQGVPRSDCGVDECRTD